MSEQCRAVLRIPSDPRFHAVARKLVKEAALAAGFMDKIAGRIELAVGEALANVTRHCYGGACDLPVEVHCFREANSFVIDLVDEGPPVPVEALPDKPSDALTPGGLGLHYIREIMDEVRFDPGEERGNRLVLKKRLPGCDRDEA